MSCLGNILWFICGGLLSGLSWCAAGVLWCVTIVGIPIGLQCFKFASLSFCPFGKEADTDLSVYAQAFRVNYYGGLRLAKCVLPYMREKQRGRILFTSSGVGVTGFPGLSPYASTKGALESLAKCLRLEYASQGISFHVIHPPLTRTRSAAPLPVPPAFMADPETVGRRLARRIFANRFILCSSLGQKLQTLACYCFPLKMGGLLAKMTARCASMEET